MANKIMKSYRIHQFTQEKLTKLAKYWNVGETAAVEIAITQAYLDERAKIEAKIEEEEKKERAQ